MQNISLLSPSNILIGEGRLRSRVLILAAAGIASGWLSAPLSAQTDSVILSFNGMNRGEGGCAGQSDSNPRSRAGLLFLNNRLYGTTPSGGQDKEGTVFSLTIPQAGQTGTKKVLHSFGTAALDGASPCGHLIGGPKGVLYGTTKGGGTQNYGTVFSLSHSPQSGWTYTILYLFQGIPDGDGPYDGLTIDTAGNLYGATRSGGNNNCGTVFELSPPPPGQSQWTETVLYRFNGGTDGFYPNGDLLLDSSTGALFGTTIYGGLYNDGTVFSLTPSAGGAWTKGTPWNFNHADPVYSAASPNGGLLGSTAGLFGTTLTGGVNGCGVVFFLWQEIEGSSQYTLKILHQFTGVNEDGNGPLAGLYEDASRTFWGTTQGGGTAGLGTVFKLAPDLFHPEEWDYSVVYSFKGGTDDGALPYSPLIGDGTGALYGTTNIGGTANQGTVFKLTP